MKKLYRSRENKIIAGILGGIAEYLEIDPVVMRIVFVLLTCITGFFPGVVFYLVALFIVPNKTSTIFSAEETGKSQSHASTDTTQPIQE
jgi:phage shock protein C